MERYILLVECPDEKGLLARITTTLFNNALNIIANGEFVDVKNQMFFMRTECAGQCDEVALLGALQAVLPAAAQVYLGRPRPKDIVILATREAHCLGDLLVRHAYGELNARIRAVISNHAVLEPLVVKFDLPFHHVPHQGLDRCNHEAAVLAAIHPYAPEYVVLAKYMRILTPDFVAHFPNRMINIHHSFLPAFIGANPYRQAYERGVKIIGATAHFVNRDLDEGPIISQDVIAVDHTHGPADMAQAGHDVEKVVLARALKLVFEERVMVSGNRTVLFD